MANSLTIPPQNITGNTNGLPVDMLTADGRVNAVIQFGLVNTLSNLSVVFYESSDNTTFTVVAGANTTVLNTSSPANSVTMTAFDRTKRYVNCALTITGGTTAMNTAIWLCEAKRQF